MPCPLIQIVNELEVLKRQNEYDREGSIEREREREREREIDIGQTRALKTLIHSY